MCRRANLGHIHMFLLHSDHVHHNSDHTVLKQIIMLKESIAILFFRIILSKCTDLHCRTLLCILDGRYIWPFQCPKLHVHCSQEDTFSPHHPPCHMCRPSSPCGRRMCQIRSIHVLHIAGQHSPLEFILLYYYELNLVSNIFNALIHCNLDFIMIDSHERILILIHT